MITIFFSFFLILAVITIISIESANLSTNQNINSFQQAYNLPKQEYYNFLGVLSNTNGITLSNKTLSILNGTIQNIYNNLFQAINISETGLNTSNVMLILPKKPSNIISYVPVTVYNQQSVSTPDPFQQLINASNIVYANYSNQKMENIEFFYLNGTIIPSWLENYTPHYAVWWIKLGSVPASSALTVYMGFAKQSSNLLNNVNDGEAPQLSSTYAEYDDGNNVFNFYSAFKGTSLNTNKWTISGSYIINNGITLNVSTTTVLTSVPTFSSGSVFDFYGEPSNNNGGAGLDFGVGDCINCNPVGDSWMVGTSNSGGSVYSLYLNSTHTATNYAQSYATWTVGLSTNGTQAFSEYNYGDEYTVTNANFVASANNYLIRLNGADSLNTFVQWIRERAYPPNGVMPYVGFGGNLP